MVRPNRFATLSMITAIVTALGAFAIVPATAASPGKLRYGGQEGQTVAYRIEITADRDNATETLKGIVTYKFNSVNEDTLQVTYSGGLRKTSKAKPSQSSGGFGLPRFGPPRFGGMSRSFGPFSTTAFRGLTTTTNQLSLTPLGEIRSMDGDSQLPYLLGNASLLIFEPLPEQEKESWSVNSGISITEEGGRRGFPFHHPFGMEESKRRSAGSEIFTYKVRSVDGSKVIVDKTYRLDSPAADDNQTGFEINGTGTWVFNRELGVPESLELSQKLVVDKGNTTTAIPMTVKYNRMTDQELAEHQEEQRKKHEEAQKRVAELQEKKANTPLTEEQKEKIVKNLKSSNTSVVLMALQDLQGRKTKESDPRLALAVDALRQHENNLVRGRAEKVAEKLPLPPGVAAAAARKRTWTDATGTFSLDAEFVALKGDEVRLRRKDGKELRVPLDRLSESDQEAARELAKGPKPIDNPFE